MGHAARPRLSRATSGEPISASDRPRLVRVAASYRSIELVADPSVDGAFVTGEHTVRRDGEALVVEASSLPSWATTRSRWAPASPSRTCPRRWPALATGSTSTSRCGSTPTPIEVDVAGASVRMVGGESGARVRLLASALKVDRVRGPLDVDAVSSSVKGTSAVGSLPISADPPRSRSALAGTGSGSTPATAWASCPAERRDQGRHGRPGDPRVGRRRRAAASSWSSR